MQNNIYSFSKFGRDAEFVIALYLKLRGWDVKLSKGSRGPADLHSYKETDRVVDSSKIKHCYTKTKELRNEAS